MKQSLRLLGALCVVPLLSAATARAQTITGADSFQTGFGVSFLGQTFTTPANTLLTNFTFTDLAPAPAAATTLGFSIYNYNTTTNTIGTALFTAPTQNFAVGAHAYAYNPNVTLVSGNTYAAVAHAVAGGFLAGASFNGYSGGINTNTSTLPQFVPNPGFDTAFSATFASQRSAVPEPGSFALLISVGLTGSALTIARRRRYRK